MLGRYDSNEFETITYMSSSGGLSCPDADARIVYYGSNGYPHLLFNGNTLLVGAGTDAIDGSQYDPVVQSMLDDASPLRMEITDVVFDGAASSVTVALACEEPIASAAAMYVRVAVVEDGLVYGSTTYDNVLRDLLPQVALTADEPLETQQVMIPFAASAAWIPANLRVVAWVQDDASREVLQSCNSRPRPDHSLRYYALGERVVIDAGAHAFGEAALFNTGALADAYTVSLDASALPAGWTASFEHDGAQHTSVDVALAPGERALFAVTVTPGGAGQGTVTLVLHSQSGLIADRQIAYSVITPDTEVLIVDDDGAYDYETRYFAAALAPLGRSFAIWDRNAATVAADVLANFDVVVWETGFAFPTVDALDRAALAAYLDGGGALFITGQDIGWEMTDTGGDAIAWYHDYLHANYVSDDTNDLTLTGEPGDPIGDGLSINVGGGDGANNQEYPSDIDPRDAAASIVLRYDAARNGGVKADTGTYRVVYFSFGFEAINSAAHRQLVMQRVIDWLAPNNTAAPDLTPAAPPVLVGNWPNPFNPRTEIVFSLAAATRVELDVFDLQGHRVRRLAAEARDAGEHRVVWDGLDDGGRAVAAGSYIYRLAGDGVATTGRMMLVR